MKSAFPAAQRFQAAAAGAQWDKTSDFDLLIDAPGADSYPLVVTVFAQMQRRSLLASARNSEFLQLVAGKGCEDASDLGYVPLPASLVTQIKRYWASNLKTGT